MRWHTSILCVLLMFLFMQLTMCPAAEKISKEHVEHIFMAKSRCALEREQATDEQSSCPWCFLQAAGNAVQFPGRLCQPCVPCLLPRPANILALLSTIRLLV